MNWHISVVVSSNLNTRVGSVKKILKTVGNALATSNGAEKYEELRNWFLQRAEEKARPVVSVDALPTVVNKNAILRVKVLLGLDIAQAEPRHDTKTIVTMVCSQR